MTRKLEVSINAILSVKNFSREDCLEVIRMYRAILEKQANWYLMQTEVDPIGSMQTELNGILARYRIAKLRSSNLTAEQLKKLQRQISNSAQKLYILLAEATDSQFLADIVAARAGVSSSISQDDDKFRAVYVDFQSLGYSLSRLIDDLNLCLKKNAVDFHAKPVKSRQPETTLIRGLSRVLGKYTEYGGYTRGAYGDKEPAYGWRLECLKYLLDRSGISKTKKQIIDSL